MENILQQLVDGQSLSQAQSHSFFSEVMQGNIAPELLASVLTALKIKGETPEEIAGPAVAVREYARSLIKI